MAAVVRRPTKSKSIQNLAAWRRAGGLHHRRSSLQAPPNLPRKILSDGQRRRGAGLHVRVAGLCPITVEAAAAWREKLTRRS